MSNNEITLSVCLLVYNHSHILKEIIESVLAQTFNDFEFIISDDNSTDSSWTIIQEYASNTKNIIAIKTPSNIGMAGNSNFAVSFARGRFIALLHHDDYLDHMLLEEWLQIIRKNANIGFVFNEYNLGKDILYHRKMNYHFANTMDGIFFLRKYLLSYWGCPVRGTALIRKAFYDEVGGMKERFGMLADVDLWMRLASRYDVGYVNKPLIKVMEKRPDNYPKDYTEFSWKRIFILFDIHANNINRDNFPDFLIYKLKRFIFRNKVSFEIIKWHIYALVKSKKQIIISFPEKCEHEYFYSKVIRSIIKMLPA